VKTEHACGSNCHLHVPLSPRPPHQPTNPMHLLSSLYVLLIFTIFTYTSCFVISPRAPSKSSVTLFSTPPPTRPQPLPDLKTADEYHAFLKANKSQLVVMKFYAGWCRSCKALAPKFLKATQEVYSKDIVFAQMDVAKNKDFVRTIGIIALPSVHFYGNEMILENFPW